MTNDAHAHGPHEDCLRCIDCGTCREDLDCQDRCPDCGGHDCNQHAGLA